MITRSQFGVWDRIRFWLGGYRWKWLPCRECGLELAFITESKRELSTQAPPAREQVICEECLEQD